MHIVVGTAISEKTSPEEIIEILRKINSRGTSVLFATHNYELVRRVDAKIIKLEDGKAIKVLLKKKGEQE